MYFLQFYPAFEQPLQPAQPPKQRHIPLWRCAGPENSPVGEFESRSVHLPANRATQLMTSQRLMLLIINAPSQSASGWWRSPRKGIFFFHIQRTISMHIFQHIDRSEAGRPNRNLATQFEVRETGIMRCSIQSHRLNSLAYSLYGIRHISYYWSAGGTAAIPLLDHFRS